MPTQVDISLADVFKLEDFIPQPIPIAEIVGLRVYNCGQGDAIGVVGKTDDGEIKVFLSVDYGGKTRHPFKPKYKKAAVEWPTIDGSAFLYTHWDLDHIWTGINTTHILNRPHLVPRQKVSPTAADHSKNLSEARCWPENFIAQPLILKVGQIDEIWIEKIASKPTNAGTTEDRNKTGLAMSLVKNAAEKVPKLIIAPGDAAYHRIPHLQNLRPKCELVGLVAYHHGAHTDWSPKIEQMLSNGKIVNEPTVVFSCTDPPQHGHPSKDAKDGYKRGLGKNVVFKETPKCSGNYIDILF